MHTIQTRPYTYFAGKTENGMQLLIGHVQDIIAVVLFDTAGNLADIQEHPINVDLSSGLGPTVEAAIEQRIRVISETLGICSGSIQIHPFFVESRNIGLKQFPLDLEEYLNSPNSFSEDDARLYRKDIDNWISAGNCVLYWGNDYLLGRDGYTL